MKQLISRNFFILQNIETYGYGKRRKVYDPDYEHVESAKFKEYERLEGEGYDEEIKVQKFANFRKKIRDQIFKNFLNFFSGQR